MNKKMTQFIKFAKRLAFYYGYEGVSPYWLLHAAASCDDPVLQSVLQDKGIEIDQFRQIADYVDSELLTPEHIGGYKGAGLLDPNDQEMTQGFIDLNSLYEDYFISGVVTGSPWEIVALGAIEGYIPEEALAFLGTTGTRLAKDLKHRNESLSKLGYITPPNMPTPVAPKNVKQPMIEKYCKELSVMAANGEIDPIIGRDKEITRIVQVLGRRRKNNPVILGPAGTGKTAIAEGLALAIENKEESVERLQGKRIVVLDIHLMLAGTKYRGQFEERITALIQELEEDPDTILFVDELHTIIGSGATEGNSNDTANILKPALARGKIQVIGATTKDEYKYIKADPALERRFQPVELHDLTDNEVIDILKGVRGIYETYHGVVFTEEALLAASKGGKLLFGRNSPDVEIDLLDETGSRFKDTTIGEEQIMEVVKEFSRSLQAKKTVGFSKV